MKDNIRWVKTHCGRMDHGGCALLLEVKDHRIIEVKGDPNGYLNKGYICPKGLASPERLNHPSRLKHPLKRRGKRGAGKWDQITWAQALSIITENLQRIKKEYGARAVVFCEGMPKGLDPWVLIRLANIFGSPNVIAAQFEWRKSNYNMLTSAEILGKEFGTPNLKGIGCSIRRK